MSDIQRCEKPIGERVRWLEVRVQADGEAAESVSEFFNRVGAGGAVLEELVVDGQVDDAERTYWVKAYLPVRAKEDEPDHRRRIEEGLWHLTQLRPIGEPKFRLLEFEDWAEAWKKSYKPLALGKHLVIKPSWCEWPASPEEIIIEIDPGQAFGTGLHPSTQLCLVELEQWASPGQKALDLGTGSGILAIAAAKLGVDYIVAIDIDATAVQVAEDNAHMNGVEGRIAIVQGTLPPRDAGDQPAVDLARRIAPAGFDLMLVNILAEIIAELLRAGLAEWLAPNGIIIAAGIIDQREELVVDAMQAAGLEIVERKQQGDWVALVAHKSVSG